MKIEKINKNKIKFKISESDLKKENITIADIESGKPNVERFFYSILEHSCYKEDFLYENSYLYIEITVNCLKEFVVIITKVPIGSKYLAENTKSRNMTISSVSSCLYLFENWNDLLLFARQAHIQDVFLGSNALYLYKNMPVLYFSYSTIKNPYFIKSFSLLSEYSSKYYSKPTELATVFEDSTLVISYHAVQKLSSYILT